MLVLFMVLMFLAGHFAVLQKSQQQSAFFLGRSDLYQYAESGLALGIHDLQHNQSGHRGNIGTERWTPLSDVGRDGVLGTLDEGEQDAIPTPGEPNVQPAAVGPDGSGLGLLVSVHPTPYVGVFLLVSTCIGRDSYVTIERVYAANPLKVTSGSALSVAPETRLLFNGIREARKQETRKPGGGAPLAAALSSAAKAVSTFLLDGADHDISGALNKDGAAVFGIVTRPGDSDGTNKAVILSQIPEEAHVRILGSGGPPSVGESPDCEAEKVYNLLKEHVTERLSPGNHQNLVLSPQAAGQLPVALVEGDLDLGGVSAGTGALLVEGSFTVSGAFSFQGLVVVRGDVELDKATGGVQILGALMADGSSIAFGGSTKILYSSAALLSLEQSITRGRSYSPIYYNER